MREIIDYSDSENSSDPEGRTGTMPKIEVLGYDLPSESMYSRHMGDDGASSSGTNLRSSFIAMGFSPLLVNKAIEEKGEDNVDLLLETLFAYSALPESKPELLDSVDGLSSDKDDLAADAHPQETLHKLRSESSDSFDSLFCDEKDTTSCPNFSADTHPKEEPDVLPEANDDKKASLVMMNFTLDEVEFAINKLGGDAPINELVDFIFAARMAVKFEKDADDLNHDYQERKEDSNTETLFKTMDKTLRLIEMGFTEREISAAIDKYGSEVPLSELADSIVTDQTAGTYIKTEEYSASFSSYTGYQYRSLGSEMEDYQNHQYFDTSTVKTEDYSPDTVSRFRDIGLKEKYKGKRPKEEYVDELGSFKKPKEEYEDSSSSYFQPPCLDARSQIASYRMPVPRKELQHKAGRMDGLGTPKMSKPNSCRSLDKMVAKPPYFFYGNVTNLSQDSWIKISQFLYAIEPEFANTQFFSAMSRKEGYIHNLPTENRFHILPKSPMTIEEAMPNTKKWWPSWDTRKQLSCISSETTGIAQLSERFGRILNDCRGLLSVEQQRELLHQSRTLNLVWVGHFKLAPIEPEYLELILGYPMHHTQVTGFSLPERLQSLKHCFQTDTLGYHLSALKSLFPGGLSVLSIYSGIGGAEITLHRLGIHLRGVVSVEPCETKRRILKQWWRNSGQSGELVQIEDVHRLASIKLDSLIKKFGGFDFIICQNPHTYSSKCPTMAADGNSFAGLDFSLFYEFVRVLQRVRSTMERNR